MLRSICANYFETRIAPLIAEVKESHDQLRRELRELAPIPKVNGKAHHKTASTNFAQLEELSRRVDLKANSQDVPTLTQFEGFLAKLNARAAEATCNCSVSLVHPSLDELMVKLEAKANVADVPTLSSFTKLEIEVGELSASLDCKANASDVSSVAQLDRLRETVERKAKQQRDLADVVRKKVDADEVPSLEFVEAISKSLDRHVTNHSAKLEKLEAGLEKLDAGLEKLDAGLLKKANLDDVATAAQFSQITDQLQQKADVDEVPTITEFEELAHRFPHGFVPGTDSCMPMVYWMAPQMQGNWNGGGHQG
eukprot:TRINITY_DN54493_c0_g1_i1.p1 TRINITY_DN54493_c0_g1~~TRINITY_DN54493_c0_g1_i1.p1  ORF type:complete len:343 (-),score=80.25 TRINITY_DN54493_c0_g1_i1:429-1358(-)